MITVSEAFDKFRARLEITKTEQDDASRRQQEVRACIGRSFDVEMDFLTGSYARHTKTKPLKDVDIFFVLGEEEKHRRQQSPTAVLDAFEQCLRKGYGNDQVERNRRSVSVYFEKRSQTQEGEEGKVLSIDAVPAFDCGRYYEIPDGALGQWIKSDPEAHKEQATKKNDSLDGRWVPLVKMIKRWNREAGKPIKPSFLIEVMALKLVDPPFNSYPDEIRRFFAAAAGRLDESWPDPAGFGPPVSDQMDRARCHKAREALRAAEVKAARAFRAEQQGRQGEALSLWREILGSYFPTS